MRLQFYRPAAVALTLTNPDGSVSLSAVRAGHDGEPGEVMDLLQNLLQARSGGCSPG
jgi:hypothetical protein